MSYLDIPGWCDFTDIYVDAVQQAPQNAVLVEVGVAFGRSLAFLASEAIWTGRRDLWIYGVDPWVDDWTQPHGWTETERPSWGAEHAEWARSMGGPFNAFVQKMRDHAPAELERVQVVRGFGRDLAAFVKSAHPTAPVSFVFIDGDHRYESVKADIDAWKPVVMSGGILAGHDYTHEFPGVVKAVAESWPSGGISTRGTSWVWRKP